MAGTRREAGKARPAAAKASRTPRSPTVVRAAKKSAATGPATTWDDLRLRSEELLANAERLLLRLS